MRGSSAFALLRESDEPEVDGGKLGIVGVCCVQDVVLNEGYDSNCGCSTKALLSVCGSRREYEPWPSLCIVVHSPIG